MYKVGDYVIYGITGVCKIEEIGTVDGVSKERVYYTLVPVNSKGSKVFTPVDNTSVIMRPVISKEDAYALIEEIKNIEAQWIEDDRKREEVYKEALRNCDCVDFVKSIKSLYLRKKGILEAGKKVPAGDEKYLHLLEDSLYTELSISLGMSRDEVEEFVASRVNE